MRLLKFHFLAFFLAIVLTGVVLNSYAHPPCMSQLAYPWERCLADFERRLFLYQLDKGNSCIVLIGASFTAALGEFSGIRNLGLRGTRLKDHSYILSECHKDDIPIYLVSIREVATRHWSPRREIFDQNARLKEAFHGFFFSPEYEAPNHADLLKTQINLFSGTKGNFARPLVDIKPFFELQKKHSNIVFVIAPILLTEDKICCVHQMFESAMRDSGLPVVNFSRIVPDEYFHDLLHLKPEGVEIVRQAIISHDISIHPNLL